MSDPPEGFTTIRVHLLDENYEMLYSAAAYNGESLQTSINRACALYEALHRTKPNHTITWRDIHGAEHSIAVLPLSFGLPRWLPLALTAFLLLGPIAFEITCLLTHQDLAYLLLGGFFILALAAATVFQAYLYHRGTETKEKQ